MTLSVTVGIPTYNNEETIRASLRQLITGTRPPDRIIIVDASSDRTPEIIENVAAETEVPIDYYRQSERGRGVGAARQDIYERFDGNILACLDTNISVGEEWLEKRVAFHETHPEYQVLSSVPMDGMDQPVDDPKRGYYFQQSNCSITAAALDQVNGWDPWLPRGEDWDMGIRLWHSGIDAYARSDLHGEAMIEESMTRTLGRPSSVAFLRKYGLWYAYFHPLHVLGDILSIVGSVALVVGVCLLFVAPPLAIASLMVTATLVAAYTIVKQVPHRDGWLRWSDRTEVVRFFFLGYTAIREFLAGDFPWNTAGFSGESTPPTEA